MTCMIKSMKMIHPSKSLAKKYRDENIKRKLYSVEASYYVGLILLYALESKSKLYTMFLINRDNNIKEKLVYVEAYLSCRTYTFICFSKENLNFELCSEINHEFNESLEVGL